MAGPSKRTDPFVSSSVCHEAGAHGAINVLHPGG
jgi:hypothetical protein